MNVHKLKIKAGPFAALSSGAKTGEVRNCSDRRFEVGDIVELRLIDETGNPTGQEMHRRISHIQTGYGLPEEICVLSYEPLANAACPGHGRSECVSCCWPKNVAPTQTCQIGIYGKAYDGPGVTRAYTYQHQPDNVGASKLGRACYTAIKKPGGDSIDLGLYLLKLLEEEGFGVFEVKS